MPYYDTLDEDLTRARALLATPSGMLDGTITGADSYAAYQLLASFVAAIEALRDRLSPDPGGGDEIDALRAAVETLRAREARLQADIEALRADAERERAARRVVDEALRQAVEALRQAEARR